jgi:hypothetical protein
MEVSMNLILVPILFLVFSSVLFVQGKRLKLEDPTVLYYDKKDRRTIFARRCMLYSSIFFLYIAGVVATVLAGMILDWDFGWSTNFVGLVPGLLFAWIGYVACTQVMWNQMAHDGYISNFFAHMRWLPLVFGGVVVAVFVKTFLSYTSDTVTIKLPEEKILLVVQEVSARDCGSSGKSRRVCADTFYRIKTDRGEYMLPPSAITLGNECELHGSQSHHVLRRISTREIVKNYDDMTISRQVTLSRGCLN